MNTPSPERFGINDPDFGRTNLLWKTATLPKGNQRFRILAGLRDTGEANAIIPVLNELSARSFDIFVMAAEQGENELKTPGFRFFSSRPFEPTLRIERIRGNALLTGMSGIPSIEMAFNLAAHARGIKVFAVEDYPGAYYSELGNIFRKSSGTMPNYLFVMNEWARRANLDYPGLSEDQIIVTGAPALDKIAHIDKTKVREEVREKLGVTKDETLISWFGQVGGATLESLQVLLEGLKVLDLKNYKLATRFHPRDNNSKEAYDEIFLPFKGKHINADRAIEADAQRVIAASDLIVQERSTIALQAAAFGIPVVSIAIPEINERYQVMMGLRVPVIEDGTSPLVETADQMPEVLEQVLFNKKYRDRLTTKMQSWIPDGQAANRVADKIIELTA